MAIRTMAQVNEKTYSMGDNQVGGNEKNLHGLLVDEKQHVPSSNVSNVEDKEGDDKRRLNIFQLILIMICFPFQLIFECQFLFAMAVYYSGPLMRALLAAYVVYCFFNKAQLRGGYEFSRSTGFRYWARSPRILKWLARYLGARIVKTAELEDRPYLFACHPHGVIGVGTHIGIGTEGFEFSKHFPHQKEVTLLGQGALFYLPLCREIFLLYGVGSADKQTIQYLIDKRRSVAINIGGAREALLEPASEDELPLILKSRKGFVKVAIENKVPIVPVYCFGENELYGRFSAPKIVQRIQAKLQRLFGFSTPLFYGVCLLPLPNKSLKLVFGAPIATDDCKGSKVTQEMIDRKHTEYLVALEALFENHKQGFYPKNKKLKFVD